MDYEYIPLNTPRKFRLLRLCPTPRMLESPIKCSLIQADLDDPYLKYTALSYVWGDGIHRYPLSIESREVLIQANLDDALRQFRTNRFSCCNLNYTCLKPPSPQGMIYGHPTFPTYLWIDAVCIDQRNLEERAQQVALMHEIYSRASKVIVWLGKEDCYTLPTIRLLCSISEIWNWCAEDVVAVLRHLSLNQAFKPFWIAVGYFFRRPWWKRQWVLQEIVLAKKAILTCGHFYRNKLIY